MIPAAEININMGVHGYGQDQMLILLREEGIKYKPDIVILGFVYEDMSRNLLQFRDYAKPKFVMDDDTLRVVGSPVPLPEEILKWDWARPRVYDVWSLFLHKSEVLTGRYRKEMEGITERLLDALAATIAGAGAVPIFVYLPVGDEITTPGKAAKREGFLLSYCEQNRKVQCFSARPNFTEKLKRGVKFKTIGHWSPLGQRTVAEAIYGYLAAHHGLQLKLPVSTHAPSPHALPAPDTVPIPSHAKERARSE